MLYERYRGPRHRYLARRLKEFVEKQHVFYQRHEQTFYLVENKACDHLKYTRYRLRFILFRHRHQPAFDDKEVAYRLPNINILQARQLRPSYRYTPGKIDQKAQQFQESIYSFFIFGYICVDVSQRPRLLSYVPHLFCARMARDPVKLIKYFSFTSYNSAYCRTRKCPFLNPLFSNVTKELPFVDYFSRSRKYRGRRFPI